MGNADNMDPTFGPVPCKPTNRLTEGRKRIKIHWSNEKSPWLSRDYTLPETNCSHLKMDGWKMYFLFGFRPIFRGELLVSGSVGDNTRNYIPTLGIQSPNVRG